MIIIFVLIGILFLSIVVMFKYLNAKINIVQDHVVNFSCKCAAAGDQSSRKVSFNPVIEVREIERNVQYEKEEEMEDSDMEEIEIEEYDEEELDEILSDDVSNIK
jgi:hypothetical protein